MKKIFFILLFIGFLFATNIDFSRLSGTPILNAQIDDRESCIKYEMENLTFCTGYYNQNMYFYFNINDYTYSSSDSFRLFFDLNDNNQNDEGEPLIFIKRDGNVSGYSYDGMQYYVFPSTIGRTVSWRGELLIPFAVMNLDRELKDKTQHGPNISVSAYDKAVGVIDTFPSNELWAKTYSVNYWSNPKSISIFNETLENIDMYPSYYTVQMMKIKIITNNEEPYKITNLKIQTNGTNANEQVHIKNVNLYSLINENKKLLFTQQYDGDDGFISFNIDETINNEYTESNPYYFSIEYEISDKLKIDSPAPAVYFNFSLISLSAKGIYTNKNLTVNGLPINSILLSAYECSKENDCENNEYCKEERCALIEPKSECGYVSNHEWIDYECCKLSDCVEGKCIDNVCVIESQVDEPVIEPQVEDPIVEIVLNETENVTGDDLVIPPIEFNETENLTELNNDIIKECISNECTSYVWEKCECLENSVKGIKKGTCSDNCNKTIFKYEECGSCNVTIDEQPENILENNKELSVSDIIFGTILLLLVFFFIHKIFYKK